ncbi:MAG TPA: dihydrolipoyl dehydrogenase [Anaerovoracaceae bacterium]|nr:dihydrolipoyl dehydrogenase [Anaerovoracaceae bacterium]
MMYDVAIIGGGPGGYVAAIRAAQKGLSTLLFEKEKLGGVCLNKGCIPTKALLKSAAIYSSAKNSGKYGIRCENTSFDWSEVMNHKNGIVETLVGGVDLLIQANKIELVHGEATFVDSKTISANGNVYHVKNMIIATGSEPILPPIEGIDNKIVITSDQMLALPALPQKLVIVGGGVIGIEFAYLLRTFGVQVTIIEMLDSILFNADADVIKAVTKDLKKTGMTIIESAKVKKIQDTSVIYEKDGTTYEVEADRVLISTGRKSSIDVSVLERLGIKHNKGMIQTNEKLETNLPGVYAIGDVNGKSMLAHTASEEGITAVENICGEEKKMDYKWIPQCIYMDTEIAWVGLTEKEALKEQHELQIGIFPMAANGKSLIEGKTTGLIKIIADKKYGQVLGAHLYCAHATDMIGEVVLAMEAECCIEDIAGCIHAHPTVSEGIMEAANAVFGQAIHKR